MCHALDAKVGKGTFIQHFGLCSPEHCLPAYAYLSACLMIRCSMVPSLCRGRVLISGMVCLLLQCSIPLRFVIGESDSKGLPFHIGA